MNSNAKSPGTFAAGSVAGFPIRVHWTWPIAVAVMAWAIGSGYLPSVYPDWSGERHAFMGIAIASLVFASVLAHEVSHAVVARRRGYEVMGITLFLLGGASEMREETRTARDEFWIAAAGPLMSAGLAVAFGAAWLASRTVDPGVVQPVVAYLAAANAGLLVLNLLPGFPLDGGRILRAVAWGRTRDSLRGMRIASRGGQVTGGTLLALGLAYPFVFGGFISGLWLAFIGWFVLSGAGAAFRSFAVRETLGSLSVGDLMQREVPRIAPDVSLQTLAEERALRGPNRAFFVAPTLSGDVLGMVTLTDIMRVPREHWPTTSVYRAMTPRPRLAVASPDHPALEALQLMATNGVQQLPVIEDGQPVGLLSRNTVLLAVELQASRPRTAEPLSLRN